MTTGTRKRRRYTAQERAAAVGIAVVEGQQAAGEKTGIPKTTIDYWLNKPEFVPLRTTAQEQVIEEFWVGVQVGLREVVKALEEPAPPHQKAAALQVIAERYALLTGAPTARHEHRELTAGMDDHERAALRRLLDEAALAEDEPV